MEEANSSQNSNGVNPAKLFVGNLSWSTNDDDLKELFGEFGNIVEAQVVVDRFNGRSKGIAFVEYDSPEAAEKAIAALHEQPFMDRNLIVNVARPKSESKPRRDGFNNRGGNGGNRGGFSRGGNRGDDRRRSY